MNIGSEVFLFSIVGNHKDEFPFNKAGATTNKKDRQKQENLMIPKKRGLIKRFLVFRFFSGFRDFSTKQRNF